ncbi:MAG: NADH-quinone oxidoreductase subunit N [Anaeromyxobacter sp.]
MENLLPIVQDNVGSVAAFLPELVLGAAVMVVLVLDAALRKHPRRTGLLTAAALASLAVVALLHGARPEGEKLLWAGLIASDAFSRFFGWLFLGAGAMTVVLAGFGRDFPAPRIGQFHALLLTVVLGLFLMASATDLLMIYLAIELVSVPSYVLAGFRRNDRRASEAALKYVVFGGVASGVMLFGMSYLFGLTGTTAIGEIGPRLAVLQTQLGLPQAAVRFTLVVSIVFVLAGVGYKISAVPWHMWCPDVYEGAPSPFTAFLSVGPKAAGFALALRLFHVAFSMPLGAPLADALVGVPWPAVIGVVAAVTMTLGNLAALSQTNLKRLLAYSSIAQAGYTLMGLAAASERGTQAVMIQLVMYLVMNLGAFMVVIRVADATGSESIQDYRGLAKRQPLAAITFAVFLFSLTGLPPLAGFAGKWWLFYAVFERVGGPGGAGYALLALCGAINTAISLYYYARIVKAMFLDELPEGEVKPLPRAWLDQLMLGGLATGVLVLGLWWQPVIDWTGAAVRMFRG